MPLENGIQGALRPSQSITWTDQDRTAIDLTGATITARIKNLSTGTAAASSGTFVLTDATNGVFRWDYHADDVATDGAFQVQFAAAFGSGTTPQKSRRERWIVEDAI